MGGVVDAWGLISLWRSWRGALVDLAVFEGAGVGGAEVKFVENEELRQRGRKVIEKGRSG